MTFFNRFSLISFIAAITFLTAMVLPAAAQETPGQAAEAQQEISDADLDNAARAYAQMQTIRGEFQQSVQQTEDQEERQQLQTQANEQLILAIEQTGLDVDTFNHIMAQVQSDEQLRETFIEKIETFQ
jgi:Flp pilus assembly protein TadB